MLGVFTAKKIILHFTCGHFPPSVKLPIYANTADYVRRNGLYAIYDMIKAVTCLKSPKTDNKYTDTDIFCLNRTVRLFDGIL